MFKKINNYLKIINKDFKKKKNTKKITYKLQIGNLLIKDMFGSIKTWRQIRGYPSNGQHTHTNSKSSKKNNFFFKFRLNQYYKYFGKKRRDIFPTLIKAEYINYLWFKMWKYEWKQAQLFLKSLLSVNNTIKIDTSLLSKCCVNGFVRTGAASKIGKSKKITKVGTIGLPRFFSYNIINNNINKNFPHKLYIPDVVRKQMGKKKKKKNV